MIPSIKLEGLHLYRILLKIHRDCLPLALRVSGDKYISDEFHHHYTTANQQQFSTFLTEWTSYGVMLLRGNINDILKQQDLLASTSLNESQRKVLTEFKKIVQNHGKSCNANK